MAAVALVIGGGIAGPVAGLALQRAGIEATIFESHAAAADGAGGTLTVAPNGLAALAVDRGVTVHQGKRLVGVEEAPGRVTARFADGSAVDADLLVGADGIHSVVRALIDPAAPEPVHVPLLNFAGTARVAVAERADAAYFVFGRRGFVGYWAQPDGSTAWFANLPHAAPTTIAQARTAGRPALLEQLRDVFRRDAVGQELMAAASATTPTSATAAPLMSACVAPGSRRSRAAPPGPTTPRRSDRHRPHALPDARRDEDAATAGADARPRAALPGGLGHRRRLMTATKRAYSSENSSSVFGSRGGPSS